MCSLLRLADFDRLFDSYKPVKSNNYLWDYYETIKINEEDGKKFIEFDLPGVRKEDVKISVEDKVLHLSAERKDRKWNFERTVTMPKSIDVTSATAKLNDGVLKVYFKESIGNKVTIPIE